MELLLVLVLCWTALSVVALLRSLRDLYDDFGHVRHDVYPEVRRHVIAVALKGLLAVSLMAMSFASWLPLPQ